MRVLIMVATLTVLAGCAATPKEMQALGPLDTVQIAAGHKAAAECAVPKFDETGGLVSSLRVYDSHSEIYGSSVSPVAFVDFKPDSGGTLASVYVSDNVIFRRSLGNRLATALRECAAHLRQPPA